MRDWWIVAYRGKCTAWRGWKTGCHGKYLPMLLPGDDGWGGRYLSESQSRSREVPLGMKKLSLEKVRRQEVSANYRRLVQHVAHSSSIGTYLTQRGGVTVSPGRCGLLVWRGRTGWYQIPLSAPDS